MASSDADSHSVATTSTAVQQQQKTDKPARTAPPLIASTSEEDTLLAANTWAAAFAEDPVLRWAQHHRSKPNLIHDTSFLQHSFLQIARMLRASEGHLINVDGHWGCAGLHFGPGTSADGFLSMLLGVSIPEMVRVLWTLGCERSYRTLVTYGEKVQSLKRNYFTAARLKKIEFYAVGMLGTVKEARGQGLASAYIRSVQDEARRRGVPVWLETSTEHAKAVYERCGFRVVECIRLGVGRVNQVGWAVGKGQEGEGDEPVGAPFWGMVWWPEGVEEERKA